MKEKLKYQQIIDGVIQASSGKDLKVLLKEVYDYKWKDSGRMLFLIGLLQGSLMQFNKEVSIEELSTFLYDM